MKKIMILPALFDHIDLIKEARKNNYKVITCDNNPDNLGHKYADVSANISLLDKAALERFAQEHKIDAVTAYSTDIGAIPSAYIACKMKLVGNPVDAVNIMANKSEFRKFLIKNRFNTPNFQTISHVDEIRLENFKFPLIVKPTDRAGSKGVSIVKGIKELKVKTEFALQFSFEKKVIVEEFIDTEYHQVHGDALVQNGKLLMCCLGDQYFGKGKLGFSPVATCFPSSVPKNIMNKVEAEIRRFIELASYKNGGVNIEVRIDKDENIYFIELAPRFGGNYIPIAISLAYNVSLIKHAFDIAVGNKVKALKHKINNGVFQFILRSTEEGFFKSVSVLKDDDFKILRFFPIKQQGDTVNLKDVASSIISVYVIQAKTGEVIMDIINNTGTYFNIELSSRFSGQRSI